MLLLDVDIADAANLLHAVVVEDAGGTGQFAAVNIGLQCLTGKGGLGIDNFLLRNGSQA